jgi:hypothetical protein
VAPLAASLLVAAVIQALSTLPVALGGSPVWPEVPGLVVTIGAGLSALYYLVQLTRLLRWRRGRAATCYVCTCLLGRERQGR